MVFLLQIEDNGYWSEDSATTARIIGEQNWLRRENVHSISSSHFSTINKNFRQGAIPVGSVEFVNKVLDFGYNKPAMVPINVPECLNTDCFCHRKTTTVHNKENIEKLFLLWHKNKLFIKSASTIKAEYTDIYSASNVIPDDSAYFVSELINIVSEWRVFVNRGAIVDIKNYCGDPWVVPDKTKVVKMVETMVDTMLSYTIDVAVLEGGETAVIEVHNFVSCGLYGFDRPILLQMLNNGFKQEVCDGGH